MCATPHGSPLPRAVSVDNYVYIYEKGVITYEREGNSLDVYLHRSGVASRCQIVRPRVGKPDGECVLIGFLEKDR